jgi:hypothetical protein
MSKHRKRRALHRRYGHTGSGGDIYDTLKAAGCKLDHHESDLYVKATPEALALTAGAPNRSFFTSQIDGQRWIELPFMYKPFWAAKARR